MNEPLWKRNLAKAHTPEARERARETRRRDANVRHAMVGASQAYEARAAQELLAECRKFADAGDNLGLQVYVLEHMCGSAEDRRAVLAGFFKMIPQEIEGAIDHTLHVKIVKQVGDREIEIQGHGVAAHPRDAVTGKALPVAPPRDLRPTPMPEIEVEAEDA